MLFDDEKHINTIEKETVIFIDDIASVHVHSVY